MTLFYFLLLNYLMDSYQFCIQIANVSYVSVPNLPPLSFGLYLCTSQNLIVPVFRHRLSCFVFFALFLYFSIYLYTYVRLYLYDKVNEINTCNQ